MKDNQIEEGTNETSVATTNETVIASTADNDSEEKKCFEEKETNKSNKEEDAESNKNQEDCDNEEYQDCCMPLPTPSEVAHHHHMTDNIETATDAADVVATTTSPARAPRRCSALMEPLADVADPSVLEYEDAAPTNPAATPNRRQSRVSRRTSELVESGSIVLPNDTPRKTLNLTYRPTNFEFYRPPRQRQKWGQTQILPRINWGDLFFDLFYVAAGYNTSNILVESPNGRGCLYFLATFLSVMQPWVLQTHYDARFVIMDDLYHRIFFVFFLCALASAVVHIRPVDVLSKPSKYIDAFALFLSLTVLALIGIIRELELFFFAQGERGPIQHSARRMGFLAFINLVINLAATIIAGKEYFGKEEDDYAGGGSSYDDYHGRILAADPNYSGYTKGEEGYDVNNLPIWLCLAAFICYWVPYKAKIIFFFPNDGSHKKTFTPLNIDFVIHRYSEWTMLMLGESILSLLIVDVPEENKEYFVTFYCSLLLIIMLQYLHFRSQPHHADDHASRKDKNLGTIWSAFQFVYSASLIAVGAALTLFLLSFTYEDDYEHRNLVQGGIDLDGERGEDQPGFLVMGSRKLAGGGAPMYPPYEMEQRTANLFSISFTIVLFSLDAMSFLHVGWEESKERCQRRKGQVLKIMAWVVLALRCGLLLFSATLSQWISDAGKLSGLGLGIVLAQIMLRRMGERYLTPEDDEETTDDEENKWPNLVHPQAMPAPEMPSEAAAE